MYSDTNCAVCIGPVVKNRGFIGVFYCIKGVHCATMEHSEFRFIALSELVVPRPSFLICVKPGHGYTTGLIPPPLGNQLFKQAHMWRNHAVDSELLCGGYTLPARPELHVCGRNPFGQDISTNVKVFPPNTFTNLQE